MNLHKPATPFDRVVSTIFVPIRSQALRASVTGILAFPHRHLPTQRRNPAQPIGLSYHAKLQDLYNPCSLTLEATPEIIAALARDASLEELQTIAIDQGMTTIAADGVRRATMGETSIAEIMRVAVS
ncbi:hypothetical protein ACFL6S_19055 [Candidatus Poribacteria bacterium]